MLLAKPKEYIPLKQISRSIRYALGSSYAFDPTNETCPPGLTESASFADSPVMSLVSLTPQEPSGLLMTPFLDSPSSVEHLVIASKTLSGNTRLIQSHVFMANHTVFATLPRHITHCDGWQEGRFYKTSFDFYSVQPEIHTTASFLIYLVDRRAFMYMGFVFLDSVYKQNPCWTFALYELDANEGVQKEKNCFY
ncbi:hypothetical protein CLU79DRAFT_848105 [Phycomyces nitens]|nr:hypothetical protein CLU79DRAFT_848105 [Phycomyces nitens]